MKNQCPDPIKSLCYKKQNGDDWFNYEAGRDELTLSPRLFKVPNGLQASRNVKRKTAAYTTTSNDDLLELAGTFELTLHTPESNETLTLVGISGQQTLTTVVGLAYLLQGESADIYYNGTEWRAH